MGEEGREGENEGRESRWDEGEKVGVCRWDGKGGEDWGSGGDIR